MKKLGRGQLLEILVRQSKELDRLQEELKAAEDKLADRRIRMEESGSIAEAALKLNGIFEAAQQAADDYLASIRQQQNKSSSLPEEKTVSEEGPGPETETSEKGRQMEEQTAEKPQGMVRQAPDEKKEETDLQETESPETDSQEKESPAAAGSFMDQYENLRRMLSARLGEKTDNE